jgi:hypothetical protein
MELSMIGAHPGSSIYPAVVMVSYEPLTIDSLDTYVDLSLANLPAQYRVTDRRKVSLNSTEAFRILIETRIDNLDANALMYILRDGDTAWILYYFAQINDFYTMLDTFEKSAKTFRVVR